MTKITSNIQEAIDLLNNNEVVAIPTETVYGLAGNIYSDKALNKIYELKKRPRNKSFILLAKSLKEVKKYIRNSDDLDLNFINNIWPGPTTLLVDYNDNIPSHLKNDSGKIAIRVSNHYPIKALFESFNGLLVSTSANISGEKNIDLVEDLIKTFHHEDVGFYNGKLGNNIKPTRIIDLNSREIIRD